FQAARLKRKSTTGINRHTPTTPFGVRRFIAAFVLFCALRTSANKTKAPLKRAHSKPGRAGAARPVWSAAIYRRFCFLTFFKARKRKRIRMGSLCGGTHDQPTARRLHGKPSARGRRRGGGEQGPRVPGAECRRLEELRLRGGPEAGHRQAGGGQVPGRATDLVQGRGDRVLPQGQGAGLPGRRPLAAHED